MSREDVVVKDEKGLELGKGSRAGQKLPQSPTTSKWVASKEGQPTVMTKGQLLMLSGKPPEVSTYPIKPEGKPALREPASMRCSLQAGGWLLWTPVQSAQGSTCSAFGV